MKVMDDKEIERVSAGIFPVLVPAVIVAYPLIAEALIGFAVYSLGVLYQENRIATLGEFVTH